MAKYSIEKELGEFHSDSKFTNSVRLISWYEADPKVDIGRWSAINTEQEYRKNGVALSIDETNALTELLVDKGFGNRNVLEESLKQRKTNCISKISDLISKEKKNKEEIKEDKKDEYYDPKEMLI